MNSDRNLIYGPPYFTKKSEKLIKNTITVKIKVNSKTHNIKKQ